MKGYELIKAITENKIKDNTKIKVTDGILETEIKYKDGGLKWKPEQFNTAFLCSEEMNFEVIEEKKEIEEKLDWEEIIGSIGKPVWDNKKKKWRVLDYYCREGDIFYVSFSDINNREKFNEKELYFKEREEK